MFCVQCEHTIRTPQGDAGCSFARGMCGKTSEVSDLQDMLVHLLQAVSTYAVAARKVGIVDAVGAAIDGLSVGEHVVINPNLTCGRCEHCRAGQPRFCPSFGGLGTLLPGGFAEYLVAPQAQVFSAEGLSPDVAVFAEPAVQRNKAAIKTFALQIVQWAF